MQAFERSIHALAASERERGVEDEAGSCVAGHAFTPGDVLLTGAIFLVSLLPLVCDRLGVGQWGAGSLGLGTAGAVLAGRALWGFARRAAAAPPRA